MRYEISEVVKKDQVMELVFGNCSKPKDLLGRHFILQGQVISAYHPDAVKMEVRGWRALSYGYCRKTASIFTVSSS